jgi:wyosine [tRNA(Phe)-imidazoG37] synthetase (radical SAM superfamily)
VYCQLGRTIPLTNQRKEHYPRTQILSELRATLEKQPSSEIDWLTFVGSGETTLYSELGWLVDKTKTLSDLPVAILTNGSLLYLQEVRQAVLAADAILPSLDAGTPELYRKINRPWPELTFQRLVDGLIALRQEYQGKIWLEVMLVRGLNDSPGALEQIAAIAQQVQPDQIHINLPIRPPAETWVALPDITVLSKAKEIFGEVAAVVSLEDVPLFLSDDKDVANAIVGILLRHPMAEDELIQFTGLDRGHALILLKSLQASGQVQVIEYHQKRFWRSS